MIITGDCLKVMPQIRTGSIDMIFCDQPYGTTRSPWDMIIPFEQLWEQYGRIIKPNGAIVLFAKPPFDKILYNSKPELYRYDWVWEKNKASGHLNAGHMPMQAHELLMVFYKEQPTYNPQMSQGHKPTNVATSNHNSTTVYGSVNWTTKAGRTDRHPGSVLHFPVVNNDDPERIHPNQKPVPLCEYMIRTYTNTGDTVLDNCSGSASISLAALRTGRTPIAIEKDVDMARKSEFRLSCYQQVMDI